MPPIFKTLAAAVAWILFIFGCLALARRIWPYSGNYDKPGASVPSVNLMASYFGIGIVSLILSVVAMKLRQMLE